MIKIQNNTPFETNISIYGTNRLITSDVQCTKEISSAPPYCKWFTEWLYILHSGPTYKSISFCIEPWSEYNMKINSNIDSSMSMGFNDTYTSWKKHVPGIYQWDSKNIEMNITCNPSRVTLKKNTRGPLIAEDIPLNVEIATDNDSWKVTQKHVTMVQYSPMFNYNYYKHSEFVE